MSGVLMVVERGMMWPSVEKTKDEAWVLAKLSSCGVVCQVARARCQVWRVECMRWRVAGGVKSDR